MRIKNKLLPMFKKILYKIYNMEYNTSPMIWCEEKYVYSCYIAEIWNSLTSLIFSLLAYYGYYYHKFLFNKSGENILINLLWLFFGFIGLTSCYFHLTLSFVGQFFDEVSINLFLMYALMLFYNLTIIYFIFGASLLSLICWYFPQFSPFILITFGFLLVYQTKYEIKSPYEYIYWKKGFHLGVSSIIFWIVDFICYMPTHYLWHIFIGLTAYYYALLMQSRL